MTTTTLEGAAEALKDDAGDEPEPGAWSNGRKPTPAGEAGACEVIEADRLLGEATAVPPKPSGP